LSQKLRMHPQITQISLRKKGLTYRRKLNLRNLRNLRMHSFGWSAETE